MIKSGDNGGGGKPKPKPTNPKWSSGGKTLQDFSNAAALADKKYKENMWQNGPKAMQDAYTGSVKAQEDYQWALRNARSTAGDNSNIHPDAGSVGSATHGKIGK